MNTHLDELEPRLLWQHFRTFCNTPRPSWQEDAILEKIEAWADAQGFAHERDAASNLRIRKPATPGKENAPGVVMQGHVDMVAEADADVSHNFETDAIDTYVENGWLKARGTTLGADNGVGACAALAILEDSNREEGDLEHGPLEVLLTVSEEVSLVGASNLAPNWLDGKLLLNLDTEEAGDVTIGCAGSVNVSTDTQLAQQPLEEAVEVFDIRVHGLSGGHSGIDINTGRASANRLLARALYTLLPHAPRMIAYDGGRMDNAITRAATATIALPKADQADVSAQLEQLQATLRAELAEVDADVSIDQQTGNAEQALSADDSKRLIGLLYALPFGPERMSLAAPGVVETSNNIGVVQLNDGVFKTQLMVRSLVDSARDALAQRIAMMFELAGFPAELPKGLPGWKPNPDSDLLTRFIDVHQRVTGEQPDVKVIHAGLECGLIGSKYPHMDMISFGPTIRGAHSPTERVAIQTVDDFYKILRATITELAAA